MFPALARLGLQVLALFYGLAVRIRNLAYTAGLLRPQAAGIPVVSLGNLTAGGTGKTPFAAYLARWFRDRGVRVVFLSRGYGAAPDEVNDEALVLDQLCPDVPHLQNPDRIASARIAREELESQLAILDDGFQHRRLARDLDIVLVDALNPWGFGHLLPRGLLREPVSALRRADLVVLTRADQCSVEERDGILRRIARLRGNDQCVQAGFPPRQFRSAAGRSASLESLHGIPLAVFCGIGNPEAFQRTMSAAGLDAAPSRSRIFPDHHLYSRDDVADLERWAQSEGTAAIVTTHKDLVKIGLESLGGRPLWALEIGVKILNGEELLAEQLNRVLL